MKSYLVYCGQEECRESIASLLEQRNILLAALKALIEYPFILQILAPRESLGSLLAQAHAAIAKCEQR